MSKEWAIYTVVMLGLYFGQWYLSRDVDTNTQSQATIVEDFVPGNIVQTDFLNGECWASIASSSDTAYRCTDNDHTIYDPCFEFQTGKVACYRDPDEPATAVISAVGDVMNTDDRSYEADRLPWVSVLEDGTRCYVMTGTGMPIDGTTYHLSCVNAETKGLYGHINKEVTPWQMKLIDYTKNKADAYSNISKVYK